VIITVGLKTQIKYKTCILILNKNLKMNRKQIMSIRYLPPKDCLAPRIRGPPPGTGGVELAIPAAPATIGLANGVRRSSEERGVRWCEEIVEARPPFIGARLAVALR
jgi:hypothetical protein